MMQNSFIFDAFTINHNFSIITCRDPYGVIFVDDDRMLGLDTK